MLTFKRTFVLAVALIAVPVAGCSDNSEPAPAPPVRKYDPPKANCPAFTGGPAATLGISGPPSEVDDPPSGANGRNLRCSWDSADYTLSMVVSALPNKEISRTTWDLDLPNLIKPVTVAGLGDQAFFSSPKGPPGTVSINVLDDNLEVVVSALPQGSTRPVWNQLAETVKAIAAEVIAAQPHT